MYVDIYSLGQGEVTATNPGGACFSLKNLQVHYGYRFEAIPKPVLDKACGSLGNWDADSGVMPMLEIVYHHQSPLAYPQLPVEFRTRDFQKSGTPRRLVPITNKLELVQFAAGKRPYALDPLPGTKLEPPTKKEKWKVPDMKIEAVHGVEAMQDEEARKMQPAPAIGAEPVHGAASFLPPPSETPAMHRPDLHAFMEDLPRRLNLDALNRNDPPPLAGPNGEESLGILDREDVEQPDFAPEVRLPTTQCRGRTARGDPCQRRPQVGTDFCHAHSDRVA